MKQRLIIDAQVFHTPAWHRGMGKYSTELISAISLLNDGEKKWDDIEIILSSKLPLEDEVIDILKRKLKSPKFVYLELIKDEITNARAVMKRNRSTIDGYIASTQKRNEKVSFLILSPMQGGICSVFPTDRQILKAAVFYDLIPFMFHEIYFRNPIAKMEFLTKLTELLKADSYLAISKTVANDLAVYLGVDPKRIISIDGAPIKHATESVKYKVDKPFILMPTGNELRKNNRIGILGFSEFNRRHDGKYSLLVTSFFDPDQVTELSRLDSNVIFTGNITGEELNYLYEKCEALLFPSKYEGLGLPVLEAVEKDKPVACSDITVFREISKTAFHFFNPDYGTSLADALDQAVGTSVNKREYKEILARYKWSESAKIASGVMMNKKPNNDTAEKAKLKVFGPNPESGGAVARTVQRLHSELSQRFYVEYFQEGVSEGDSSPRPNMMPYITTTHDITDSSQIKIDDKDIVVYHIENSDNSAKTLFTALANPGLVVLYDIDLSNAWTGMLERQKLITSNRYELEKSLDSRYGVSGALLLTSLIASQKAIIVFSKRAQMLVGEIASKLNADIIIQTANFPVSAVVYDEPLPSKGATLVAINPQSEGYGMAVFKEANSVEFEKQHIYESAGYDVSEFQPEISSIKLINDRYFEDVISRAAISFSYDRLSTMCGLEAARYGVIPATLLAGSDGPDMPDSSASVGGVGDLNKLMDSFSLSTKKDELSRTVQKDLSVHNSYREFVRLLEETVELVKRKGNEDE